LGFAILADNLRFDIIWTFSKLKDAQNTSAPERLPCCETRIGFNAGPTIFAIYLAALDLFEKVEKLANFENYTLNSCREKWHAATP
jgi:hypothetical protein